MGQFTKNYRTFYPEKLSSSSQKYGLGSGIRDPESGKKPILEPGSRGQKGTESRIQIRNTDVRDPRMLTMAGTVTD